MSTSNDSPVKIDVAPEPLAPITGGEGVGILQRWEEEDMLKRGLLGLRGVALFFSFISFILVASNKHGGLEDFEIYQQYRYLLAIAILSSIYTGGQVYRQIHELSTGKIQLQPRTGALIDFFGDQVMAYLLISSASSAIPITDLMRKVGDDKFTDSSAAAITMSFIAFISLALSSLTSGYKLSVQSYF